MPRKSGRDTGKTIDLHRAIASSDKHGRAAAKCDKASGKTMEERIAAVAEEFAEMLGPEWDLEVGKKAQALIRETDKATVFTECMEVLERLQRRYDSAKQRRHVVVSWIDTAGA
ncbi:MAG: hypothetical protein N3A66_02750 [Planctomycetota bacterium]|nr:hypothetical protein [Planctomycetota bacterium]